MLTPPSVVDPASDHLLHRPQILRMSDPAQASEVQRLRGDPRTLVSDTLMAQLCDLMKVRRPREQLTATDREDLAKQHLGDIEPDDYGTWTYYPWSRRLLHLLAEVEFIELRTDRNRHKITAEEQRSLAGRVVGVVGLSAGNAVALTIALERSCGELRVADFDELDLSNLNRLRCGLHEIGVSKAHVTARSIAEMDPYLRVTCFTEGYTEAMADEFFEGLDLVVDECDGVDAKFGLRFAARTRGIPVLMATSDSGSTDVERFDLEPDRPLFHGWVPEIEPSALLELPREAQVAHIAQMARVRHVSPRLKASVVEIGRTVSTWPQLGSDVTMGGAVIADLSRRVLLGEQVPSGRSFVESHPLPSRDHAPAAEPRTGAGDQPGDDSEVVLSPVIRSILEAAVRAPSGGNNQPWHFTVEGRVVHVGLGAKLAYTAHDHQHRAAVTALGAAIENAVLAAHAAGHRMAVTDSSRGWDSIHASLTVDPADGADEPTDHDRLAALIPHRYTSRVRGQRVPLAPDVADRLHEVAGSVPGCRLTFIEDLRAITALAELMGRTERVRMLSPALHREVVGEFRFTPQEVASTGDGIAIAELEFDATFAPVVEILRDRPTMDLLRTWDLGHGLGDPTSQLCVEAAAFLLITMPSDGPGDYLAGGRAMERVWLEATGLGLAVQPVSSLTYLALGAREAPGSIEPDMEAELLRIQDSFLDLVLPPSGSTEIVLLRLAYSDGPSTRSRRRPLGACTTVIA